MEYSFNLSKPLRIVDTVDTDINSPNSRSCRPTIVVHSGLLAKYRNPYDFDPAGGGLRLGS